MGKPYLPDIKTITAMGINPKTGLPVKLDGLKSMSKSNIKKVLRIIDEQDAVNRYTWYNLPMNLSSQELERMLYYKGQLAFFYLKDLDEYYFMPFALDGQLDFYGRYKQIHPVPFNSGGSDKKQIATQEAVLSEIKLNCVYGIKPLDTLKEDDLYNSAVLLWDYSKQLPQEIIPRVTVNDGILDIESDCIPYMRTALLMGTGVRGVRVNDADQQASVSEGAKNLINAALNSEPYVPITGSIQFQELTNGQPTKADDYLIAMQSLDNLRLSTYGIDNGGLFEKKSYVNNTQANLNKAGNNVGLVLQDGLSIRQDFCNIVNSIWGTSIWCEISENITNMDITGDGVTYERDEETTYESESEDVDYD